jgi:two-component system, sensor histidine kinase and response regulator
MRILIAEDDPEFRHLLGGLLTRWGYDVVATADGKEAWEALHAPDAPKVAILDWIMPGLTGVELARKIRHELSGPYVYVILLTAQQMEHDLVAGMEAGADDYLTKPLKVNEFRVRLNAAKRQVELQEELLAAREVLAVRAAELEQANRDLESFSYTVANEVLVSLLSIADNSKTIQDLYCDKVDQQCRTYTRRIYEKTRDLGQLIGVMLEFFRPTRTELRPEIVDLSQMVREAADKLRMGNPERRVTFKIAEGVQAEGDKALLRVVVNNLLDNAWKHTARQEQAVIEFGSSEVQGKRAFFLRDNGSGFDMAEADVLFRPFQRLPQSKDLPGRGIGLATVDRNIRRHGGRVWAEGESGKGATFYFTI